MNKFSNTNNLGDNLNDYYIVHESYLSSRNFEICKHYANQYNNFDDSILKVVVHNNRLYLLCNNADKTKLIQEKMVKVEYNPRVEVFEDELIKALEAAEGEIEIEIDAYIRDMDFMQFESYEKLTNDDLENLEEDLHSLDIDDIKDILQDRFNEIIDGAVPIYTYDIDRAFLLHKNEIIEAYEEAGYDGSPYDNDGMTALYCWLEAAINEELEDIMESVKEEYFEEIKKEEIRRKDFIESITYDRLKSSITKQLMKILKSKSGINYLEYCSDYAEALIDEDLYYHDGLNQFLTLADDCTSAEISQYHTKSGRPEHLDLEV